MDLADDTKLLQRFAGVKEDGEFGPVTAAALVARLTLRSEESPSTGQPEGISPHVSERSARNIATLLPQVQEKARQLIGDAAANGIAIEIISGTRTYEEQDTLFAQGGVTKARGGFSNHNFGLAFDVGVFRDGVYLEDGPEYRVVGALGKSLGLSWGGDWHSFVDEPHFELHPSWADGMTESEMLAQLREIHESVGKVFV